MITQECIDDHRAVAKCCASDHGGEYLFNFTFGRNDKAAMHLNRIKYLHSLDALLCRYNTVLQPGETLDDINCLTEEQIKSVFEDIVSLCGCDC